VSRVVFVEPSGERQCQQSVSYYCEKVLGQDSTSQTVQHPNSSVSQTIKATNDATVRLIYYYY